MSTLAKVFALWKDPMFDEIFVFEKEHVSNAVFEQLELEKIFVHTILAESASEARQKVFGKKDRFFTPPKVRFH